MRIVFYLVVLPLSRLPFRVLYGISNLLYLLLYRLVGYRKKVVRQNLKNSFPLLTPEERKEIERKFYRHFCDIIVESVKIFTITKEEIQERFTHRNPELFDPYFKAGRHVALVGGHYGNWELFAVSIQLHIAHQPLALYTPLTNPFFNKKILESRSRFGLWMRNYAELKEMMKKPEQQPLAVIFGSDQCPKLSQQPYWMEFLHQETGVQFGTEKFARDYNAVVIYGVIHHVKRGVYETEYRLVCDQPYDLPLGKITEIHTRYLEQDIMENPTYWLWTHKRWKRTRNDFQRRPENLAEVKE